MRKSDDAREDQTMLTLADGTSVPVREIQSDDAPALQRLVSRLSEQTIRLRFLGPKDELDEEKARYLAEVDGTDRYGLVALDPEDEQEIVAMVQFDREEDKNKAEYAALIEDRFQGKGLGFGLTRSLIEAARERDVQSFDAIVASGNRRMLNLLRSLDLPERTHREEGIKRVEVDLFPEGAQGSSED